MKIKAICRHEIVYKNGKSPLAIRFTHQRTHKTVSLGISVEPHYWDKTAEMITANCPERAALQSQIDSTLAGYRKKIQRLEALDIPVTFDTLFETDKSRHAGITIEDGFNAEIERLESLGKINSATKHKYALQVLNGYKSVKTALEAIITADPFAGYEAEHPEREQKYLTAAELQRLMTTPLHDPKLYHIRDLFLFSCYTGIPYGDMCRLTTEDLEVAEDGEVWIKTARKKTKIDYEVPLLDIPLLILDKYRDMAPEGKLLPMYSNNELNRTLKRIAAICGIERKLVFHCGRHTYATEITLSHGVPLETVSKMLGHSRISTTQIYAKVTDDKIDMDTRSLEEKIAGRFSVAI